MLELFGSRPDFSSRACLQQTFNLYYAHFLQRAAFQDFYPFLSQKPVFFIFICCLYATVPAGYGGNKLWKPSQIQGLIQFPNLLDITGMSKTRFNCIKSCLTAAFIPNIFTTIEEEEKWCPIQYYSPTVDPWKAVQGLVNQFNENQRKHF